MRVLAVAAVMAVLAGCATAPSAPQRVASARAAVVAVTPAPRRSQQELLAAYWAERRAPRRLTSADFTPPDFTAAFTARSPGILQNFPASHDSEDQSQLDTLRLERESAATREAVRAAMRR